ncbi:MAG: sulfurtransferase-like selenium metabolism protein YedF [Mucinivorans sp.]
MIVDTSGQPCPAPLVMTKRAIKQASAKEPIEVISDNSISAQNLETYLHELGLIFQKNITNGLWHFYFTTSGTLPLEQVSVECPSPQKSVTQSGYALVIRSEFMGSGDDALGALLMRSCVNSLGDLDLLPTWIVLYNSGVKLTIGQSDTAASLTLLRNRGVQILVCGTCVDFYGIKEQIGVGSITNMFKINDVLSKADHVIYP